MSLQNFRLEDQSNQCNRVTYNSENTIKTASVSAVIHMSNQRSERISERVEAVSEDRSPVKMLLRLNFYGICVCEHVFAAETRTQIYIPVSWSLTDERLRHCWSPSPTLHVKHFLVRKWKHQLETKKVLFELEKMLIFNSWEVFSSLCFHQKNNY